MYIQNQSIARSLASSNNDLVQSQIEAASFQVVERQVIIGGVIHHDKKAIHGIIGGVETPLSIMGADYFTLPYSQVIQNLQTKFANVGQIKSVELIDGGRQLLVMISLGFIEIAGMQEEIVLLAKTSLNGKWVLEFEVGIFKMICSNGMILSLMMFGESNKVKHSKFAAGKIEGAENTALQAGNVANEYKMTRELLDSQRINQNQILPLLLALTGAKSSRAFNTAQTIADLAMHGKGNDGSTLDSVFNGITDHFSHGGAHKDNGEKRLVSSLTGTASNHKARLYKSLVDIANTGGMNDMIAKGEKLLIDFA